MTNSIRVVDNLFLPNGKNIKNYEGLSTDVINLPTENEVTGSTFFAIDTGKVYKFEETSQTWYEI